MFFIFFACDAAVLLKIANHHPYVILQFISQILPSKDNINIY